MSIIPKQKWILPSISDGNAFMIRATKAEEQLKQALDILDHVEKSIPHKPASQIKEQIVNFIKKYK